MAESINKFIYAFFFFFWKYKCARKNVDNFLKIIYLEKYFYNVPSLDLFQCHERCKISVTTEI